MNDDIPTPPFIQSEPASNPPEPPKASSLPPQPSKEEIRRIKGLFSAVEALLREPYRVVFHLGQPGGGWLALSLFVIAAVCGLAYGFVTGTFSGGTQLWAAPLKISGGLLFTGLICMPSLYIFACLKGAQAQVTEIAGFVGGLLAILTVLLIGFAPVIWLFSQSTDSLPLVSLLHVAFGLAACYFGLRFVNAGFSHFGMPAEKSYSRYTPSGGPISAPSFWKVIFVLVALQMTTALRPIVGTADTFLPEKKQFFVKHWAECASEVLNKRSELRPQP
jgi:hypothetical protein